MKTKITEAGQPCRHCGTPVERKSHNGPTHVNQNYWFTHWFRCPNCGTVYLVPEARVNVNKSQGRNNEVEIPEERLQVLLY